MFADENEFRKAVRATNIDDAPRPQHQQELRERVLAAFDDDRTGLSGPRALGRAARLGRILMHNRLAQVSAASLAAACILLAVLWTLGPGTGVALAKVQELIQETRTLCYQLTAYRNGQPESTAQVMFMEPGRMRAEWPGAIGVFDWNQGQILSLMPEDKTAILGVVTDMDNPYYRNWLADLKAIVGNNAAEELGRKDLLGQKAKGWRIPDEDGTCTVWADAKTGELIQVEFEQGNNTMVMSHFVLNPDLDEALFDMTPPEGYKLMPKIEMSEADPSEADVLCLLRVWVSGNNGQFPDRLDPAQFSKAAAKADWADLGINSKKTAQEFHQAIGRAFYLLHSWKLEWGYVGQGVQQGQADRPVFWHRTAGAQTYRVIYGDFHIVEVSPDTLKELIPQAPPVSNQ